MTHLVKVRSPSKYLSLDYLLLLQVNYYISKSGREYHQVEVDSLIRDKESRLMDQYQRLTDRLGYLIHGE